MRIIMELDAFYQHADCTYLWFVSCFLGIKNGHSVEGVVINNSQEEDYMWFVVLSYWWAYEDLCKDRTDLCSKRRINFLRTSFIHPDWELYCVTECVCIGAHFSRNSIVHEVDVLTSA